MAKKKMGAGSKMMNAPMAMIYGVGKGLSETTRKLTRRRK